MKTATLAGVAVLGLALLPLAATAGLPEGKVAVIHVTAVEGLAAADGPANEFRSSVFSFDGTEYTIAKSALPGLDGVTTLLLIDRRKDEMTGDMVARRHTQEVRAFASASFEVKDLPGKVLAYQVAMLGGNLRLLGDSDQIRATGGPGGPFSVWKVTGFDLVDRESIHLN